MVNHDLMEHGLVEGVAFEGLMPGFIAALSAQTVGASEIVVKEFGREAKGMDALEIIDAQNPKKA